MLSPYNRVMIPQRVIEGTGEEIAKYTKAHPADRFQLILLSEGEQKEYGPGSAGWESMMDFIHSLKGKVGITLPLEATSTEALYD